MTSLCARLAAGLALMLVGACGSRAALDVPSGSEPQPQTSEPTDTRDVWQDFCEEEAFRITELLEACCGYDAGDESDIAANCVEQRTVDGGRSFDELEANAYFEQFEVAGSRCTWPEVNTVGQGLRGGGEECTSDFSCASGYSCRGGLTCQLAVTEVGGDCSSNPCSHEANLVCAAGQCIRLYQPGTPIVCP